MHIMGVKCNVITSHRVVEGLEERCVSYMIYMCSDKLMSGGKKFMSYNKIHIS